ncbi:MAG: hypothetical protein Q4E89_11645 [Eubacteriales bacterium]|nr:hypothetical protein [Eubacteriales bacterium]
MDKRTTLKIGNLLSFPGMECTIESFVGCGSNAMVYMGSYPDGQFKNLRHRVLIKELFPYHAGGRIFRGENQEICVGSDAQAMMDLHRLSFQRGNEVHLRLLGERPQDIDFNLNTFSLNHTLYTVLGFSGGRSMDKELSSVGSEDISLTTHLRRMLGALDVLEGFHSAGFLHLDISPDNILLIGDGRRERISLIDYNSVHTLQEIRQGEAVYYSAKEGYTAPEIRSGKIGKIGFPSDLYALTAVFYRCLSGKNLTAMQAVRGMNVENADLKCLHKMPDTVCSMVKKILKKGLASLPRRRYQNAAEMRIDLEELQDRIEGKGITHWALWESGRAAVLQTVKGNHAWDYIKDSEKIYPIAGETETGDSVLLEDFIRNLLSEQGSSVLLIGSGGAGKTTALLRTAYMQKAGYSSSAPAVSFLSLYGFTQNNSSYIKDRILENLKFKPETDSMETARHELLSLLSSPMHTKNGDCPKLLLLLDGLNEVSCSTELLLREIESLNQLPGVRILMTSRSEENAVSFPRFYLKPLPETEVRRTLSVNGLLPPENAAMLQLLQSPMMLSVFIQTALGQDKQLFIETQEQLLEYYFDAVLKKEQRNMPDNDPRLWQIDAALYYVLPEIARLIQRRQTAVSEEELFHAVERLYHRLGKRITRRVFPNWIGHISDIRTETENAEQWYGRMVQDILWRRLGILIRDESGKYLIFHQLIEAYLAEKQKSFDRIFKRHTAVCSFLCAVLCICALAVSYQWGYVPYQEKHMEEKKQPYEEALAENVLDAAFSSYFSAGMQYEDLIKLLECLLEEKTDETAYERYIRSSRTDLERNSALRTQAALSYSDLLPPTGEVMPWSMQPLNENSYKALVTLVPNLAKAYLEYIQVLEEARADEKLWEDFGRDYLENFQKVITADAYVVGKYYNDVIAPELSAMETSSDEKEQQNYHLYITNIGYIREQNTISSEAQEAIEIYLEGQTSSLREFRQNALFHLIE